jgi:hypothetical protein
VIASNLIAGSLSSEESAYYLVVRSYIPIKISRIIPRSSLIQDHLLRFSSQIDFQMARNFEHRSIELREECGLIQDDIEPVASVVTSKTGHVWSWQNRPTGMV